MSIARAYPHFFRFIGNPSVSKSWAVNNQAMAQARTEAYGAMGRLMYLRMTTMGQRLGQAKTEAGQTWNAMMDIGNVSAANMGKAALLGFEVYLLFNIGEIFGRGSIVGYPVGPNRWAGEGEHH